MGAFYILEPTNTCYSQYKGSKLVCLFVGRASVSVLETCVAHWRRLWVAGGHRTREPHPSITSLCPPLSPALCPTQPRAERTSYRGQEYNSGDTTKQPQFITCLLLSLYLLKLHDGCQMVDPFRVDKYFRPTPFKNSSTDQYIAKN